MGWVGLAFFWMLLELVFSFKKLPLLWAAWLNPFSIATFLAESRTWVLAWITFEAVFRNVLYRSVHFGSQVAHLDFWVPRLILLQGNLLLV